MAGPRIYTELLTYGLGVALSPIHIILLLLRGSPLLQHGKTALLRRGELVVGSLTFGLGTYLGWQGISGLMLS